MRIVPKLQQGGSMFTTYTPILVAPLQPVNYTSRSRSDSETIKVTDSSKKETEDTKGKLSEKDLFNMIKDVDGLPNEMKIIVNNLKRDLDTRNLTGVDTGNLAASYLSSLYKLKVANLNKKRLDESLKTAKENGSLGEIAITLNGNIMASTKDGNIAEISLEQYLQDPSKYSLLTNSNLAWLRKYSSKYAFAKNDSVFEIIDNGMGYESFQSLLDKAKVQLGSYKYEEQGIAGKEALLGLRALQGLSSEELQKYIQDALEGRYQTNSSTESNEQQIKALVNYLTISLPKRAKVWASLKTGIADQNKATQALVGLYLAGNLKQSSSYKVDYLGSDDKLQKAGKGSSDNSGDTKQGFWGLLLSGKAGDEQDFNVLIGKNKLSVNAKFYGTTPGLDKNKSLSSYIADSGIGYLIKNRQNIMFGDQAIASDSLKDIMVNANGGAMRVTLPTTADGKINFEILDTYSKVDNKLRQLGFKPGTKNYYIKLADILKKVGLGYLVNASSGEINPKYFGLFLVLEGVTSSKAHTMLDGKKLSIQESVFLENASSDDALYDSVREALSSKDSKYELDNNWISFNNDSLYKGNIYIPLNTNPLNAINADGNDVKSGAAKLYEKDLQIWDKRNRQLTTSTLEIE